METRYELETPENKRIICRINKYTNNFRLVKECQDIMCGCTGNTVETATAYVADPEKGAVCPKCGRTLKITKKPRDFLTIYYVDYSLSSGQKYYRLSSRLSLSEEEWKQVKSLFDYFRADDEDADCFSGELCGWLVSETNLDEVKRILKIE